MIMKDPAPDEVCDFCTLPLESGYVKWAFPRKTLFFHGDCAYAYSSRLRNQAFQFRRYQEKHEQTPNQETPERLLPLSPGTQSAPSASRAGRSPVGLRDTNSMARPA